MAWEFRGNHAYYYRKERIGAKVKSVYIGNDEGAHVIAEVDRILRIARREVELAKQAKAVGMPKP